MSDINSLKPGEIIQIGSKIYGRCGYCDGLIRVDKPILGSLHLCLTPEECAEIDRSRAGGRGRAK